MCIVLRNHSRYSLASFVPALTAKILYHSHFTCPHLTADLRPFCSAFTITTTLYFKLFPGLGQITFLVRPHVMVAIGQILRSKVRHLPPLTSHSIFPPPHKNPEKFPAPISSLSFPPETSTTLLKAFETFVYWVCVLLCSDSPTTSTLLSFLYFPTRYKRKKTNRESGGW